MYEMYTLDELKMVLRLMPTQTVREWITVELARIDAVRQAAERFEAIEAAERRQPRRVAKARHLASCLFMDGRWLCAADCRHHVIVDVDAEP